MKIYTVYKRPNTTKPEDGLEFVPESFSWAGFIFPLNIFWAVMNKCWMFLAIILFVETANVYLMMHYPDYSSYFRIARLPIVVYFGLSANDYWRKSLERKGYQLDAVVAEDTETRAKRKYFEK